MKHWLGKVRSNSVKGRNGPGGSQPSAAELGESEWPVTLQVRSFNWRKVEGLPRFAGCEPGAATLLGLWEVSEIFARLLEFGWCSMLGCNTYG